MDTMFWIHGYLSTAEICLSTTLFSESPPGQHHEDDHLLERDSGYWERCGREQSQCQELSEGQKPGMKSQVDPRDRLGNISPKADELKVKLV